MRHCLRWAVLSLLSVLLVACNQTLDWREYHSPDGGYKVLLPGKPGKSERELTINGQRVKMQMASVAAADTLFGVGYVDFSPKAPPGIAAQFRVGLARHLGGKELTSNEASRAGNSETEFHGEGIGSDGKPVYLRGRIVLREYGSGAGKGERLYQIVQIGKPRVIQEADQLLFVNSFTPLQP